MTLVKSKPQSMTNISTILAGLASLVLVYYIRRRVKRLSFPPSPKGYPFVGNAWDVPTVAPWEKYHQWCKELGSDILYLDVAGVDTIVLDSYEVAMDLLEKRSAIYSSRKQSTMVHELMGWKWDAIFAPYGEQWRAQRKFLHQTFHPTASKKFRPHALKSAHGLLRRLLTKPGDVVANLRHMSGSTIISITYGVDVQDENDPFTKLAEEANRSVTEAAVPGAFLVDSFPVLKYVPEWFPGAGFKKKAREWKELATGMLEKPYQAAISRIETGNYVPSFVAYCLFDLIEKKEDVTKHEYIIKSTAAAMYSAGSDTTVSVVANCIIGLLKHPEILKRAQEEIDSVVEDLPTFDHEDSLPYVTAICLEAYRWRNAVPISVPHLLIQDDVYKGYTLPKDAVIVPNSWAMLHDETAYPDPFAFKPERFLKDGKINKEIRDPTNMAFGYGRRICPSREFGISAIWITIASLIATLDIANPIDENGNVIEVDPPYEASVLCIAKSFTCSIRPRSKKHEQAIFSTLGRDYDYQW